ncbi:hypothetical protein ACS0TY_000378 [Phlomoides rotata]
MTVSELILPNGSGWDTPKLYKLFSVATVNGIISLPITCPSREDNLAWRFTKIGNYSTKSGYKDALQLNITDADGSDDRKIWNMVWSMQIIPKIKFFIWRVLHNILRTLLNLTCRFVDVDPLCKHCGVEIESADHALRDCAWLWNFWNSTIFAGYLTHEPIDKWVGRLLIDLPSEEGCLFTTLMWTIWWGRNNLVFRGKGFSTVEIRQKAEVHRVQYHEAWVVAGGRQKQPPGAAFWKPPEVNFLKLNIDASVRKGWGATIGGVLRNSGGEVIWCFAQKCEGVFEVDVAEALAVEKGLEFMVSNSLARIVVESDSQTVVNALREPGVYLSYIGKIIRNIEMKAKDVEDITFTWTRRTTNIVAHKLAMFAYSCNTPYFSTHVPISIESDVDADVLES